MTHKRKSWRQVLGASFVGASLLVSACGSSGPSDQSKKLVIDILTVGQSQMDTNLLNQGLVGTSQLSNVSCIETGNTQVYTCLAYNTLTVPSDGVYDQKYRLIIHATCNSKGNCQWHTVGSPVKVG